MSTHQHTEAALAAVQALHRRAKLEGDREAIEALREIALRAIGILDLLTAAPADHPSTPKRIRPGVAAAHEIAKQSARWPVALDAVKEIRMASLARWQNLEVGSAIGIRLAGKKRGFAYGQHTGFAFDLFGELDAIRLNSSRHIHPADLHPELVAPGILTKEQLKRDWRNLAAMLPELSKATLPLWAAAAVELCREYCMNDWQKFPWPECVMGKAGKDPSGDGTLRTEESAIRGKISDGLKALIA